MPPVDRLVALHHRHDELRSATVGVALPVTDLVRHQRFPEIIAGAVRANPSGEAVNNHFALTAADRNGPAEGELIAPFRISFSSGVSRNLGSLSEISFTMARRSIMYASFLNGFLGNDSPDFSKSHF
jgi:hypothetical protein